MEQRAQKSFGSFAKRTGDKLVFLQLRRMLDKTNRTVLFNESGMATTRFSFFLLKKKQNRGRHCRIVPLFIKN